MVLDIKFRDEVKEAMKTGDDKDFIKVVLEHVWQEYPRPTMIWFMHRINDYDQFRR